MLAGPLVKGSGNSVGLQGLEVEARLVLLGPTSLADRMFLLLGKLHVAASGTFGSTAVGGASLNTGLELSNCVSGASNVTMFDLLFLELLGLNSAPESATLELKDTGRDVATSGVGIA